MPSLQGTVHSMTANGAVGEGILVTLESTGKIQAADLGDVPIGVTMKPAFADGDVIPVQLICGGGTLRCFALTSFAVGAIVYGRAAGKVDDVSTSSAVRIGVAMEAASGVGHIVEIAPFV